MSGGLRQRQKMNLMLRQDEKDGKITLTRKKLVEQTCSNVSNNITLLVSLPKFKFMDDKPPNK